MTLRRVIFVKKTRWGFKTISNALTASADKRIIATMGWRQISRNQPFVLSSSSKLTPYIMLLTSDIIVYHPRKALRNWVTLTNKQMQQRLLSPEKNKKVMKCSKIFSPCKLSLITFFNKRYFFDKRNSYVQVFQMTFIEH